MTSERNPFHTLYGRIFLWFCLTIAATFVIVIALAALTGAQPFGRRWMALTQDLYARSAADFYTAGGQPALARYLQAMDGNAGMRGQLLDENGLDLLGQPLLADTSSVQLQARRSGLSNFRVGRIWTSASPVNAGPRHFLFLMRVDPLNSFLAQNLTAGPFVGLLLPRILLALSLIAIFCLLLARHITEPIRVLEEAATQLAAGSLSVRAVPRIAPSHLHRQDELGRMAKAFDTMAERIQSLLLAQQEMLGHISHELRSPLSRIAVSLELLRRAEPRSLHHTPIDQAQEDLDRMERMIAQILEITRIDLAAHQPAATASFVQVDLCALLEDLAADAAFEAQLRNQTVTFHGEPHCTILGDPALLRSACENIVRNALFYSDPDTAVAIRLILDANAGHVRLLIQDHGPGVPPEALPHLFQLFYRVHSTSGRHPQGTGSGLALAQRIVTLHRGHMEARNLAPHGLEITLTLPLAYL